MSVSSMTTSRPNQLPEKMQAVVAYAPGDYRFEEVDVPRAGPDDIIIEVEACGICAGDIKAYEALRPSGATTRASPATSRRR